MTGTQQKAALQLLDHTGQPLFVDMPKDEAKAKSYATGLVNSYWSSLAQVELPALMRARDPYSNHVWVFAGAVAIATAAAAAPYVVFRESADETDKRAAAYKRRGEVWRGPRRGRLRRAVARHMRKNSLHRVMHKGLEVDHDSELIDVLHDPNPFQKGNQLLSMTYIWLSIRGEHFWVMTDEDGGPPSIGKPPDRIWPMSPDCFEPAFSNGSYGELVGWWMSAPRWYPYAAPGQRYLLSLDEVVQFKYSNPNNPLRGWSRMGAAAASIEKDLYLSGHELALLKNRAVPEGILETEQFLEPADREAIYRAWEDRHKGEQKAGRVGLLWNGLHWNSLMFKPSDLQADSMRETNQQEILAAMGTPPSIVGGSSAGPYAQKLAEMFQFWEGTVLPMLQSVETPIDASPMFFEHPDSVFGAHDLSQVHALRAGLDDKIGMVARLGEQNIHMPPKEAFELVGIDAPDYPGSDTAFVGALATPVQVVLDLAAMDLLPSQQPVSDPNAPPPPDDAPPPEKPTTPDPVQGKPSLNGLVGRGDRRGYNGHLPAGRNLFEIQNGLIRDKAAGYATLLAPAFHRSRIFKAKNRWAQFVKVQAPIESRFRVQFRAWVKQLRADVIRAFDAEARRVQGKSIAYVRAVLDLTAILPLPKKMAADLQKRTTPLYSGALEIVYDFTTDEIGIPTFAIDDSRLISYFDRHESQFVEHTGQSLFDNLRAQLSEGLGAGDTVEQLRARVARVFDVTESSAKANLTARTTSSSFMNGERDVMFEASGITSEDWFNAGDEVVRPDHVLFGEQGPQPRGFNYLTLPGLVNGTSGTLEYPGDLRAAFSQRANCRCLKLAIA